MKKLTIELVPKTAWYTNVRSMVSKKDWDNIREEIYMKAGYKCQICDAAEPLECHEIWEYDDKNQIQKLKGMIALCKSCHEVKHIGLADRKGLAPKAREHLSQINSWSKEKTLAYIKKQVNKWKKRSKLKWKLNIDWLENRNIKYRKKKNLYKDSLNTFSLPEKTLFIAIDYETANADYSSICQIGIVCFDNNDELYSWSSLINPKAKFTNTYIHGITKSDVSESPSFRKLYKSVLKKIENHIIIHHTAFDKAATRKACDKHSLPQLNIKWLDSSRIARHTWKEVKDVGYGLDNIASKFNFKFFHHNALEDARIAGKITIKALQESSISIEEWLLKAKEVIHRDIK